MEEKCLVADLCGGCDYQGIRYNAQIKLKEEKIKELFSKYIDVSPILGDDFYNHYRNKVQVSFGKDRNGDILVGNYAKNSHFLVPIDNCQICDERAIEIINSVKRLIKKYHISIYDERIKKGCMRHLLIRTSTLNEIMLVLVTGSPFINKEKEFIHDILKYNPSITTIIHNINRDHTSMILGNGNKVLYGKGYIIDELMGLKFKISASSFYQINHNQTVKLYSKAIEYANLKGNERLIDAFCGTGTIGLLMSKYVKEVIGVEINSAAIKDANKNKEINNIKNINFICEDAGKYMQKIAHEKEKVDVVVMDPPRAGSSKEFLKSVAILKPNKVVYISCNPDTLLRDVQYLMKNDYKLIKIQPVDMFPYTSHVETVVLMSRIKE